MTVISSHSKANNAVEKYQEVELVAMTVFVAEGVAATLAESDDLTVRDFQKSILVLVMYGSLWYVTQSYYCRSIINI